MKRSLRQHLLQDINTNMPRFYPNNAIQGVQVLLVALPAETVIGNAS